MSHVFYFRAMLITLGLIALLQFLNSPIYIKYILIIIAILLGVISYRKKDKA